MAKSAPKTDPEFHEDDIFFECPHCGKSMAIERHGMGLTIQCPSCGGLVKVPKISEDPVAAADAVALPPAALSSVLEENQTHIEQLQAQIAALSEVKTALESMQTEQEKQLMALETDFLEIQQAVNQLAALLEPGGSS